MSSVVPGQAGPATAAHQEPATTHRDRRKSLLASGVGNILEWYDWSIYAIFSPYISKTAFDPTNPTSALLATLAVFGVGFGLRPIGGMVLGVLADRWGRKGVMIVTMLMMALGSGIIALSPSYAQAGNMAGAVLLAARLLQGFAHGGEYAASYAYIAEIAPPARRGLWASSLYLCVGVGVLMATLAGVVVTSVLSSEDALAWGWRLPFAAGALLALFALYLRRGMVESEEFGAAPLEHEADQPAGSTWLTAVKIVVFGASTAVVYYTWASFAPTMAITQRGMDPRGAFLASAAAQVVGLIALPFAGMLADRVGRKPVLLAWAAGFLVLQLPLTAIISTAPVTLFAAQSIALTMLALATSINPAIVSEVLPTRQRARVIGVAGAVAASLFGGTSPLLNAWLTARGMGWAFSLYLMFLLVLTSLVVLRWPETKGIAMRDAGRTTS